MSFDFEEILLDCYFSNGFEPVVGCEGGLDNVPPNSRGVLVRLTENNVSVSSELSINDIKNLSYIAQFVQYTPGSQPQVVNLKGQMKEHDEFELFYFVYSEDCHGKDLEVMVKEFTNEIVSG